VPQRFTPEETGTMSQERAMSHASKPRPSAGAAPPSTTDDAFFRDALLHSPFGVFMTTPAGQITFANQAMARILGYDSPEDLMTSVSDVARQIYCDPADRESFLHQLETREDLADQEGRVMKRDGTVIWLGGTTQAVRDDQGRIVCYRGYVTDITRRKEIEGTLERTGQKYRELVENINDVIYDVGLDGRIRYLSPSARNIFEHAESLIGRPYLDIVDPRDREQARDNWARMAQGLFSTNEYRLRLAPDSTIWVRTSSRPAYHDGTMVAVVGVLQDITDRKLAEEALRMSEERYRDLSTMLRLICDNVPDMIWAKDLNKRYIFANKAICAGLLGAEDVEEPLGKTDLFFAERERSRHADNPSWHTFGEICRDTDQITMDAGRPQQFDEYGNIQGQFLFLDVRKAPLLDENGVMTGTVGSARDVTDYKRIEGALREREERFRTISLMTSDMVYFCEHDPVHGFELVWIGGAVERITGYDAEELLAQKCWGALVPPVDQDIFVKNIAQLRPGESAACELRMVRKNLTTIWVESKAECLAGDAGRTDKRLYGSLVDITKRKEAESALRLSEYQHRVIFQNSPLGMVLFDGTGTIVDCNAALEQLMGAPREKIVGFNTAQDSSPEMRATIQQALLGQVTVFEGEYTSVTGGISRMLRVIFNPISNQTPSGLIATLEDISQRKLVEEAVLQEKTILHNILEDILAGYWDWEIGSTQKYLSPSLKRRFGYDDHELPNTYEAWLDLVLPEDTSLVLGAIKRHVDSRGNLPFNVEVRFRHKDGHTVWMICAGRIIRWSDTGQPLRMVGCHVDISRQKDVEEALLLAKKEADAANRIKSEFLANMSHELRTPLNGVMGILDLLETTGLNKEQEEYTSMGMQACRRLVNLLTDILDLSRIEAGVLHIQKAPISLREIFRQTEDLFSPTAKAQGVALELQIHPGVPDLLEGDGVRLQQVLTNLVGNALKFTQHGWVRMEASALPARWPGRCQMLFSVSDSGIGIPDDKIGHLFQPFSQIDMGYTRAYQGAGLGLSICKRLVALMGGTISVVSEPGNGTTFSFTAIFELETGKHGPASDSPDVSLARFSGLRALLVEDDTFSSAVTSKMLNKYGILVEQVENGQQALAALGRGGFDLVLMDIRMPVMDGVTAVRAIRTGAAGQEASTIPIIALTAHAMEGDRATFLEAGMNDYVSKPVIMSELIFAISNVLAAT
jgi:PAS domain S-box-containing protein